MAFENLDIGMDESASEALPMEAGEGAGAGNRTFMVVAGVLGAITLLALLCIALYAFVFLPRGRAQQAQQVAQVNAQNTQVAQAITSTAAAANFTYTPTATRIPPTATRTPTPVIAVPTRTQVLMLDARTATVAALLTQAAGIQKTPLVKATSTALPKTGFAEDVGAPGMFGLAIILSAVIFLSRRLRLAN